MTRMDIQIQLKGEALTLQRDTGSVEDDYGDVTPVWGDVSLSETEYIWVMKKEQGGNEPGPAGILDEAGYLGLLQSFTEAQELDMVLSTYRIEKLSEVKAANGDTSHYEADLRKVEEG